MYIITFLKCYELEDPTLSQNYTHGGAEDSKLHSCIYKVSLFPKCIPEFRDNVVSIYTQWFVYCDIVKEKHLYWLCIYLLTTPNILKFSSMLNICVVFSSPFTIGCSQSYNLIVETKQQNNNVELNDRST